MRTTLTLFFLLLINIAQAQLTTQERYQLKKEIGQLVNDLRKSKGLTTLESDVYLAKAANNQAVYMAASNVLSHNQPTDQLKTPAKRVAHYEGKFEIVGENVLFTQLPTFPLSSKKISRLALQIYTGWKKSPGHYKNMIHPAYKLVDYGFAVNKQSRNIYAAQVLGKKGVVIPNQLTHNAFGILPKEDPDCKDIMSTKSNVVTNMGNAFGINDNEILLKHHNKYTVAKLLTNNKDGIAVDLISREQVACKQPNRLDMSPIYEGIMLQPVFKEELFQNNTAQSDYRLTTVVGQIPAHLHNKDIQASLIFIKNGNLCAYRVPIRIPGKSYELVPIEPLLYEPDSVELISTGISKTEKWLFDFERSSIIPKSKPTIKTTPANIQSVEVISYSSIEGDAAKNKLLHQERAQYIKHFVEDNIKNKSISIEINSKENWEAFYYQLELLKLDDLIDEPKEVVKEKIRGNNDINWDSLLFLQRRSHALIHYKGTVPQEDTATYLAMNLRTAILENNYALANKAMVQMYRDHKSGLVLFEDAILAKLNTEVDLVQNGAALLTRFYWFKKEEIILFVRNWLKRSDELSDEARRNLLYLYTVTTKRLLDNWDVKAAVLANVLEPENVYTLLDNNDLKHEASPLLLNYHLASVLYYGQTNNGIKINESFNFIADHFSKKALNIDDEIALCLFFNNWSRYDLTINFLQKRINSPEFNEEAAFIFAQTIHTYKDHFTPKQTSNIMKRAYKFNPKRWCQWVDESFQLLRNPEVKKWYCGHCQ